MCRVEHFLLQNHTLHFGDTDQCAESMAAASTISAATTNGHGAAVKTSKLSKGQLKKLKSKHKVSAPASSTAAATDEQSRGESSAQQDDEQSASEASTSRIKAEPDIDSRNLYDDMVDAEDEVRHGAGHMMSRRAEQCRRCALPNVLPAKTIDIKFEWHCVEF